MDAEIQYLDSGGGVEGRALVKLAAFSKDAGLETNSAILSGSEFPRSYRGPEPVCRRKRV